jgi:hypothetical protein
MGIDELFDHSSFYCVEASYSAKPGIHLASQRRRRKAAMRRDSTEMAKARFFNSCVAQLREALRNPVLVAQLKSPMHAPRHEHASQGSKLSRLGCRSGYTCLHKV